MKLSNLKLERLIELLSYDSVTGTFTWKTSRQKCEKGSVAGTLHALGYRHIKIDGVRYLEHQLAWYYIHGKLPEGEIDHINGIRNDNRIVNLRDVSKSENQRNSGIRKDNTTGVTGVTRDGSRWKAQIRINGKKKNLGRFNTFEEAKSARLNAEKENNFSDTHGLRPSFAAGG